MLTYYIAQYLVPGAIGKIFHSFRVAEIALYVWNEIGLMLVFLHVITWLKVKNLSGQGICAMIMPFFSIPLWLSQLVLKHFSEYNNLGNIQQWFVLSEDIKIQYSSNYVQLRWVFPQAIVIWLTVMLLLEYRDYIEYYVFMLLPSLMFGAFGFIGILPLAMMVGIDYIISCIVSFTESNENRFNFAAFIKQYWKKIIPYGMCYLPGLLPVISTLIRFHTVSLVADDVMEHKYLLTKALNYLFDLNLGIFPYEPVILILFIIMVVVGLKNNRRAALINGISVVGMLYIISNQFQINCGMQGIMRYNVWIIPIMIFYVIMNWKMKMGWVLVSVSAVYLSALLTYVNLGGAYSCLQFAPWTKVILDHAPQLYNPTHGIFYSRASGGELYYSPGPVEYTDNNGVIKK